MTGGPYDSGYKHCPCFWGDSPGSYVIALTTMAPDMNGWRVLDVGCGEGKNAEYLASRGVQVIAADVSNLALANARRRWVKTALVAYVQANVEHLLPPPRYFDAVIAYGLLHCLSDADSIRRCVNVLKASVRPGGYHVVCSFNERNQDLRGAHIPFEPTLLSHDEYLTLYSDWEILCNADRDLHETHPHNGILHTHSLTRLICRKPS